MEISIVVPLYNCSSFIDELWRRLKSTVGRLTEDFEVILVNDGSPSDDWRQVAAIAGTDRRVKGINLSRNFGQHCAIWAGLSVAAGKWVVVMDGDLQDLPEEIEKLYGVATAEGYDIVLARRLIRQDSRLKKMASRLFYRALAYLTSTDQNAEIANFGIYHRRVIQAVRDMNDDIKYFPTMIRWVGFRQTEVVVDHGGRNGGRSGYNVARLFRLALDVILSFSDKPLVLTVKFGLGLSLLSFVIALMTFLRAVAGQIHVSGYSSLMISIWFLSGVIITIIGMVGLYVGRIFDQVRNRPIYIVDTTLNIDEDD